VQTKLSLQQALRQCYSRGEMDYWMAPLIRVVGGKPVGKIGNGDSLFFCCRRGDRETQLTEAFADPGFGHFEVEPMPDLAVVPLVQFHEKFADLPTIFPVLRPTGTMGEALGLAGVAQTRIAESEKAAHVTFFFNGRRVAPYSNEQWVTVPSPHSSEFLSKPATSTMEVAFEVERAMVVAHIEAEARDRHFILVNLAAGDIIGHLDDWDANILCAEAVDQALSKICTSAAEHGYVVAVTADHGLLERFVNEDGSHNLSHTRSRVPFGLVLPPGGSPAQLYAADDATLADVAPTLLSMMGIPVPDGMTGKCRGAFQGIYGKVVMVVLDGWGIGVDDPAVNPIVTANTPCMDRIANQGPYITLAAAGLAVGLPEGRSGNSETGHLTLGAGRVVPQDELRIGQAIRDGELKENEAVNYGFDSARKHGGDVHVIMMLSERSSHGNMDEALAVLQAAVHRGITKAWLHVILDGRSSPPQGAVDMLELLAARIPPGIRAEAVTAMGRAYALDRSGSYREKTQVAYRALVEGEGRKY
jgi:2,3-bisphosphoglycerate-independent phosphoglycerate mutase